MRSHRGHRKRYLSAAIVTVVVDAEVDLVVGLVEVGVPRRSLPDINFRQPLSGAPQTLRDGVHPEIGVKARALAMGVVWHLKAGLPVPKLLDKLGILGGRAAGLQRGAWSTRRPHLQTIRPTESTALVVLSAWVVTFRRTCSRRPSFHESPGCTSQCRQRHRSTCSY